MIDAVQHNVLIVSEESATTRLMLEVLAARSIRGCAVRDSAAARDRLASQTWDLVVLDSPNGHETQTLELLAAARAGRPELAVVILSAGDDVPKAVQALRHGAQDCLAKPIHRAQFEQLLDATLPSHEVAMVAADQEDSRPLYQIAGQSPSLVKLLAVASRVAPTSVPVLVTGESGTGKELVSYFLHRQSRRRSGPYIRVNCAALSESLLESELFGHERGAFTGAHVQRKGKFERAHGGTLLLDEISETSPRLQAQLLRVLEQQDFERVGGTEPISVNVRVISTSNRDLAAEVQAGRFRRDLFYRLGGIHLVLPALRDRKEDIPPLVWHFVNQYASEVRRPIREIDTALLRLLCHYHWPGNVRQLRNAVRTLLILGQGSRLSMVDGVNLFQEGAAASTALAAAAPSHSLCLQELEKQAILEALRRTQSHQARAAKLLGITDRTLREKLRRYRTEDQPAAAQLAGDDETSHVQLVGEGQWLTEP